MINIYINQIGYLPDGYKTFFINGNKENKFRIVDIYNKEVYCGIILTGEYSKIYGQITNHADFTNFRTVGKYKIVVEDVESVYFEIKEDVYYKCLHSLIDVIYLQRCGSKVVFDNHIFDHEPCHIKKARIYNTNKFIDVSGGWHDAGDYGRYVVPGAKTVLDLLIGSIITNDSNIQKKLLEEVRYEIEWMFKMQREDGAVYHKVTCRCFPGFVMPQFETDELIVSPVSTTATADFIASMAVFAVLYKSYNEDLSKKCFEAALKALSFINNSQPILYKNPNDILTGEYDDKSDLDERFLANSSLFYLTHNTTYEKYLIDNFLDDSTWACGVGWDDVAFYGLYIYLLVPKEFCNLDFRNKVEKLIIKTADMLVKYSYDDNFHISLNDNFAWGSNMLVCNYGFIISAAYKITNNKVYKAFSEYHVHYLFGCNPLSMCYITEYGYNCPKNPHHRPSAALGITMPGMLVGGPSKGLQDPYAYEHLKGSPSALCYIDNLESYSTNEICIYWNSALIMLLISIMN